MRPRKRLVVYCSELAELQMTTFILQTRLQIAVTPAWTEKRLVDAVADCDACLVIHVGRGLTDEQRTRRFTRKVKRMYPDLPMILLNTPGTLIGATGADYYVRGIETPLALMDAVSKACRKRAA